MPNNLELWIAVGSLIAGVIVWGIRLEGRVNLSDEKDDQITEMIREHYATKNEVSILKGTIDTLAPQLADTKNAVLRIENKVDAFLVAALQQGSGGAPHR